jgi:hypothetical protein
MTKRGKTKDPAKPEDPREALAWWNNIVEHIRERLQEYRAHEPPVTDERYGHWLSDVQRLRWFVDGAAVYGSGKNKRGLEQLLGLKAGPGRRSEPGKHFPIAYKMFLARLTPSTTRKSKKGEPTLTPWKEVGRPHGLDGMTARKIVVRELPNIEREIRKAVLTPVAKKIDARMRKKHPIRKITARRSR